LIGFLNWKIINKKCGRKNIHEKIKCCSYGTNIFILFLDMKREEAQAWVTCWEEKNFQLYTGGRTVFYVCNSCHAILMQVQVLETELQRCWHSFSHVYILYDMFFLGEEDGGCCYS